MRYNNPFSVAKIEKVIELLGLDSAATVLDIGSGKAELLIRLIERYQVNALGLELDPSCIQDSDYTCFKNNHCEKIAVLEKEIGYPIAGYPSVYVV